MPKGIAIPAEERRRIVDDALARLAHAESLEAVARLHKIDESTLRAWMLASHVHGEAMEQRAICYQLRIQEIERELEEMDIGGDIACAKIRIARARELLRSIQWQAERRCPAHYGLQVKSMIIQANPAALDMRDIARRLLFEAARASADEGEGPMAAESQRTIEHLP